MKARHGEAGARSNPTKVWFPYWKPRPGATLRLFCFPFAGGSASVFHRWAERLPSVEVLAVQYPGRETRFAEPPARRASELVEALGPVMLPLLEGPFAFFGYSLGTLLSLQLVYWLRRAGAAAPRGVMMAAGTPPNAWKPRGLHTLPDAELIRELQAFGATPPQVLAHRELMELLLPTVRADFEVLDTFTPSEEAPLSIPMAVWGGTEDSQPSPQALEGWRDYTSQDFTLQLVSGGHFFLFSAADTLLEGIEKTLHGWSAQRA